MAMLSKRCNPNGDIKLTINNIWRRKGMPVNASVWHSAWKRWVMRSLQKTIEEVIYILIINNNKSIFKVQNLVPRDYSKRAPVRMCTCTHTQRKLHTQTVWLYKAEYSGICKILLRKLYILVSVRYYTEIIHRYYYRNYTFWCLQETFKEIIHSLRVCRGVFQRLRAEYESNALPGAGIAQC